MEESSLPFDSILADCLAYVRTAHGEVHAQRLFFELYNAIFTFLDRELGEASVDRYWEHLGSNSLGALSALVAEHGLDGMRQYWSMVAADEDAVIDTAIEDHEFRFTVRRCPPTEWLESAPVQPYPRYPLHCKVLYQRVAAEHGYEAEYHPPDPANGTCCRMTFRERGDDAGGDG